LPGWLVAYRGDLSVPDMTYNVFSGTLNPTQSINRPKTVTHPGTK